MPAEQMTTDVRALLDRDPFDASAMTDLLEVLGRDPSRYKTLRDAVSTLQDRHKGSAPPAVLLRLGVAKVLLGRYNEGLEELGKAGETGMAHYYRGQAFENLARWEDAAKAYAAAAKGGYEAKRAELKRVGALRRAGKLDEARKLLETVQGAGTAEYHFQRGCFLVDDGDLARAASEFEKCLEQDREHTGAMFQLAYINDLYGNDDAAIQYYTQCLRRPPVPVAALINLGILYEDDGRFREAETCFRQVLNVDPNHPRARLFFRDCQASRNQYFDEEFHQRNLELEKVMRVPVTDFELSVRSRNCLRKMNIRTLGDLARTTEVALLASKNFGETSLAEIKQIMESKGLRLGMALEAGERGPVGIHSTVMEQEISPEEKALLSKAIAELNLSVRARKCMSKLNIQTVGELLQRSGDDLLECKNFGVTSLNEVREKLTSLGLKLKNE